MMAEDEIKNEDETMESLFKFLRAEQKAEEEGKQEFTCPLCGGKAWWARSSYNNHKHTSCTKCGMYVGE